jgi:hypothetical protein
MKVKFGVWEYVSQAGHIEEYHMKEMLVLIVFKKFAASILW